MCYLGRSCKNRSENAKGTNIKLFSFPKDEETAIKWMQVCKEKVDPKNGRICSVHFTPSCYKSKPAYLANCENYSPQKVRKLYDHALPTENLEPKEKEMLKEMPNQENIINISENTQNRYVLYYVKHFLM
ncbi:uncharacterized protein LOC105281525 [Ooceraea biroi]|uniref:uncharacterized protein LOC105281525 n=1 Tax=Ooceraea biroi TaxID=2015173 RepID=UPI000F096131|nr:uncharacterized protein LOC105281525 [Ooceraea biroi]